MRETEMRKVERKCNPYRENIHSMYIFKQTAEREDIMAIVEVKRKLRSTNESIYGQIGAQMYALMIIGTTQTESRIS